MFSAALDDWYGRLFRNQVLPSRSRLPAIEPSSLDWLTILPAGDRRSSGSIAFVTATTPNTLVA
jgi:hypothetical protein